MPGSGPIDPKHAGPRKFFRTAGPVTLAAGVILMLIGFADLACTMGHRHHEPTLFWCFMLGMPVLFAGGVMTQLGFMGRIARYMAQETTPVATDSFNYAVGQTKRSVRDLARAVGEGLGGADPAIPAGARPSAELACPRCLHKNDADARFCSQCGSPLVGCRACPNCRHENDLDARFCDNCGQALGT